MTDLESPQVDRQTFVAILEEIVELVEDVVHPDERPDDALAVIREQFEMWYEDDDLEFGAHSVSHSLEEASIQRRDRRLIPDTVGNRYEEIES